MSNPIILEYPTHTLTLSESENGFVKVVNIVKQGVYDDMISVLLRENISNPGFYFVEEERKLLNNFIHSLVGFYNTNDNSVTTYLPLYIFSDDLQYQIFCLTSDVNYKEQEWFKTIYVKTSLLNSISILKQASTELVKQLYPEHFKLPENLLETAYKEYINKKVSLKCDYSDIELFLQKNDIHCLYHFTSKKNIKSIIKHGICSLSELERMGLEVDYGSSTASREIDKNKSLSNFVHLSYEQKHPMLFIALAEGRLFDYSVLRISPEVIILKNTLFSDINAASNEAKISADISFFMNLNFISFHNKKYCELTTEAKRLYQAEVLVEKKIEESMILNFKDL